MNDRSEREFNSVAAREQYRDDYWMRRDPIYPDRLLWRAQSFRHLVHLLPGQTFLELGAGLGLFTVALDRVAKLAGHPGDPGLARVWGINDWNVVPRAVRPGRTEIADRLMRTTMLRDREKFVATIEAPVGATLDYGFALTKRRGILDFVFSPVWDGQDDHPKIEAGRTIQGKSTLVLPDEFSETARAWKWIASAILIFLVSWAVLYWLEAKLRPRTSTQL